MNYGLYLSAAGALTNLHKQDVIANNLANLNTIGFKPDQVTMLQRLPQRLESPQSFADPQWLLERLGGGKFAHPTRISMKQGALVPNSNPFDLAVDGEGLLAFQVRDRNGEAQIRFSRDGRLTLNTNSELVSVTGGHRALDINDQPIVIDRRLGLEIRTDGAIVQNGAIVAQLQLTSPPDAQQMHKVGGNLIALDSSALANRNPATGQIKQRFTESSAVDPILTLNALIGATKAAQGNIKMMQYHDNIMGQAINTLGRVA